MCVGSNFEESHHDRTIVPLTGPILFAHETTTRSALNLARLVKFALNLAIWSHSGWLPIGGAMRMSAAKFTIAMAAVALVLVTSQPQAQGQELQSAN